MLSFKALEVVDDVGFELAFFRIVGFDGPHGDGFGLGLDGRVGLGLISQVIADAIVDFWFYGLQ